MGGDPTYLSQKRYADLYQDDIYYRTGPGLSWGQLVSATPVPQSSVAGPCDLRIKVTNSEVDKACKHTVLGTRNYLPRAVCGEVGFFRQMFIVERTKRTWVGRKPAPQTPVCHTGPSVCLAVFGVRAGRLLCVLGFNLTDLLYFPMWTLSTFQSPSCVGKYGAASLTHLT